MNAADLGSRSATIPLILYLYKNPKANVTDIIANSGAGQKAVYSAKEFLEAKGMLLIEKNPKFPHNPLYSLSEKGMKVAKNLIEIQKLLEEKQVIF